MDTSPEQREYGIKFNFSSQFAKPSSGEKMLCSSQMETVVSEQTDSLNDISDSGIQIETSNTPKTSISDEMNATGVETSPVNMEGVESSVEISPQMNAYTAFSFNNPETAIEASSAFSFNSSVVSPPGSNFNFNQNSDFTSPEGISEFNLGKSVADTCNTMDFNITEGKTDFNIFNMSACDQLSNSSPFDFTGSNNEASNFETPFNLNVMNSGSSSTGSFDFSFGGGVKSCEDNNENKFDFSF